MNSKPMDQGEHARRDRRQTGLQISAASPENEVGKMSDGAMDLRLGKTTEECLALRLSRGGWRGWGGRGR